MRKTFYFLAMSIVLACCVAGLHSQDKESTTGEPSTSIAPDVQSIIDAGKKESKVQEHLDVITNQIGPRLTGSEGLQAAGEWARDYFKELGLESRMEKWGEFPVGFERGPSYGRVLEPSPMDLTFGTNAWTAGTKGRSAGRAMLAPKTMEEFESVKDQIDGAYIFLPSFSRRGFSRRGPRRGSTTGGSKKKAEPKTAEEKAAAKKAADDAKKKQEAERKRREEMRLAAEERAKVSEALAKMKPAGLIRSTTDERILTGGRYQVDWEKLPTIPSIRLLKSQYDKIKGMLEDGKEVKLEFDIRNHFRKGPIDLYNVIAEIKGTEKPEECVIVGGHLDSWDGATGATDNAAGCATTIEAARILMAAGVKPKRTIRFMLWSGEEQGLLGSRKYVELNKDDVVKSVSAVFVHDGGTNYVAGIRCTAAMRPHFEKVFAAAMTLDDRTPFEIETVKAIYPRGGSDHTPFISVGVPGFFWSQKGRAVYRTTHHTQFDTYDTIVPEYQKHSAMVIALGAYGTANLDELLPREGVMARTR